MKFSDFHDHQTLPYETFCVKLYEILKIYNIINGYQKKNI